jgi:uracil-DNA glycosylase
MNSRQQKLALLAKLADERRKDRYRHYHGVGDLNFFDGIYDRHDFVSPWTIGACNVESSLMLIAQDWSSADAIREETNEENRRVLAKLGHAPDLKTNKNIQRFLCKFFGLDFRDIYATNLFVFVKPGKISANIPRNDLAYSARKYTLEEIKIVRPKMVICIGQTTHSALRGVIGYPTATIEESLNAPAVYEGAKIFASYHTGYWGTRAAGGEKPMEATWKLLGDIYRRLSATK